MKEFLEPILFRVENLFTVLSSEVQQINSDNVIYLLINGGVVFIAFYFVSRWFRAYIIRVVFFLFGAWVLWQVSAKDSILNSFDFYGGLGMILPQLEIVEITYLLLVERTLFGYRKIQELFFFLSIPFVWLFNLGRNMFEFFQVKQEEKTYSKNKSEYEEKSRQYHQEQKSSHHKQKQQHKKQEPPKQEKPKVEKKTYEWWESPNNYERLQLKEGASRSDIEKDKKRLRKLYHPDLVFMDEEKRKKHTIIFQNITNAYDKLK